MKRYWLKALTLFGCFSTGIIYGSIGVIAILSFFKLKKGGADESSFFVLLDGSVAGRILVWLIIAGAVRFVVWRLFEAFADPHKVGSDTKAIMLRTGAAFSSVADAFIAYSALQVLLTSQPINKSGEPVQQQQQVEQLLNQSWGQPAIIVLASILLLTAMVLGFYGMSNRFTEAINAKDFTKRQKWVTHALAYLGYLSRAIILSIIGYFYLEAAIERDSSVVVNTDKAFDFIGDNLGAVAFLLTAAGTLCYGLFMFVLGLHYDVGGRKNE